MGGDARELSEAQVRDLPEDIARGMRSIVRSFAEAIDEVNDRIDRLTGSEGSIPKFGADGGLEDSGKTPPGGSIVGDTDEQTLTNKTMTDPTMTGGTIADAALTGPTITDATMTDPDFTSTDGSFEFVSDAADTDINIVFGGTTNDGQLKWMEDEDYFLLSDDIMLADDEQLILGGDSDIALSSSTAGQLVLTPPANTDIEIEFAGTTATGSLKWMEDEDYFQFADDIAIAGGENIVLSTTTGTMIGATAGQLLGFWGTTPVNQPGAITDAAVNADLDGVDTVNEQLLENDIAHLRNKINFILAMLREIGLIA